MTKEVLLFENINGIAKITLNRPEVYHCFNKEMAMLFHKYLDRCKEDDIRVVFITATGKAFCSGQDLKEVMGGNITDMINDSIENNYNPLVKRIFELEKPVMCAVNGISAGAGANIALVCDIVVAKESATFIQAFSKIGLIPDSGGTYVLPRLIGFQKAIALAMLAETVNGIEAEKMGMIYKAFPDDTFETDAWAIAERLAKMPTKALGLTKKAYNQGLSNDFYTQLEVERRLQMEAGESHDFAEGVMAFVQKRKPEFKGK